MKKGRSTRVLISSLLATVLMASMVGMVGCGGDAPGPAPGGDARTAPEKIVFAWEPSNSGNDYEAMRDSMAAAITEATGIPCEVMTTTDYNVTIEALSSGQAQIASSRSTSATQRSK